MCKIKVSLNSVYETLHLFENQLNAIKIFRKIKKMKSKQTPKKKFEIEKKEAEQSLEKKDTLIEYFKKPFSKKMVASYFYTTEDATVMRKTEDCPFYLDLVNINFDQSNLSKKEEKVMDKKYRYLSTLETNLKFLKFDQIFQNIYKKLGDPDL